MQEVKAYIKEHKLSDVISALHQIEGLIGLSVIPVKRFGKSPDGKHIVDNVLGEAAYVKLEFICDDELLDTVVSGIKQASYTGIRDDGFICVSSIEKMENINPK